MGTTLQQSADANVVQTTARNALFITLYSYDCQACGFVISVAWGLPFASQEEDNEFLGLKRLPYPANWHAVTVSEQMNEYWSLLKRSSQYSMDMVRQDYLYLYLKAFPPTPPKQQLNHVQNDKNQMLKKPLKQDKLFGKSIAISPDELLVDSRSPFQGDEDILLFYPLKKNSVKWVGLEAVTTNHP
ncbi:hypothetical protein L345_08949, partial [Ophiophagus hannah]